MTGPRPLPMRDEPLARARALLIARLAIALYIVELLLNLVRPHLLPDEPALSIFYEMPGDSGTLGRLLSTPRLVFWIVLAGIVAGAAVQIYAALTRGKAADDGGRRAALLTWITLGCLLLPFGLISLTVLFVFFPITMLCLPSTALVMLLLRVTVRFGRLSWTALLLAFGWGALIVFGLGRAYTSLAFGTLYGYLGPKAGTGLGGFTASLSRTMNLLVVHLSVVNALVIAAGVALLLMLLRHRVTDAVTGLVLGGAVGLGYNFVESILFIKIYGTLGAFFGPTGGFEYWIRQSIGVLGGQVTFGALIGAGLGAAVGARRRGKVIAGGLLAGIGGAAGAEILSGWLAGRVSGHVEVGSTLDTLVISPFFWLLPQLPFLALAVALLVTGLRSRASLLRDALAAETTAAGPITAAEAPVLAAPGLRFWALVSTWRSHGRGTALALHRLQSAQLDLAGWRAGRSPETDTETETEAEGDTLRARVMRGKGESRTVQS
ncbi:PrsW family glutamic-type intramembrane protease [Streptomyces sp. NPDC046887]|uniref:PrsW family glutamic-type intramembrane protease n=1 Tax=Streptomyces sp. NPDC046887 TaxID=3155472 RepID=UPI0033C19274